VFAGSIASSELPAKAKLTRGEERYPTRSKLQEMKVALWRREDDIVESKGFEGISGTLLLEGYKWCV
jgi:hypothetical protein